MPSLQNHIALVTGASRGIGKAIAFALAKEGADVAINYRQQSKAAESVADKVKRLGRSITVQADVSESAQVDRLFTEIEKNLGTVDILVNNAGIASALSPSQVTEADWHETIRVNLTSVFLVTQRALPAMRAKKWGRIINLSSVAAQYGGIVGPHYSASKAGILGLTRSYAHFLAKEGITVNAIAPALADVEKTNKTYKMIWVGCGDDDTTAVVGTRNLHNLLTTRGVHHTYVETPGAHHDYQIWRVYLATNLLMLFRE